jgi:hypothetical protein
MDKFSPILIACTTDIPLPTRKKLRNDTLLPNGKKSNTEMWAWPSRTWFNNDMPEPSRTNPRTEIALPMFM